MNVNGSRFHMLLGEADWGRCTAAAGGPLQDAWDDLADATATDAIDPAIPAWNATEARVTLALQPEDLPPTPGETVLTAASRRAAAADRHGNLYAVSGDRAAIEVVGATQRHAAAFWPDLRYRPPQPAPVFQPAVAPLPEPHAYTALAVTSSDYLVVGFATAAGPGLLRFDLAGGGEPELHRLGALLASPPVDLASDGCGGLFLLDGEGARVLHLDGSLQPVPAASPAETADMFQPDDPLAERRHAAGSPPLELPVPAGLTALQLVAAGEGEALVLARRTAGGSALLAIDPGTSIMREVASDQREWVMAARIPASGEGQLPAREETLHLVPPSGNQAFAFALLRDADGRVSGLAERPTLLPMRRFDGRALVLRGDDLIYDSGDPASWVPLVEQRRRRYAELNRFDTPVFDGREPQCVWDRIRLDACIPPGTRVRLWARAADERQLLDIAGEEGWIEQPIPYLNRDGGELAGKRRIAMPPTDPARGIGCWDLLLQNVVGRYVRLRIELAGDGRNSPMLRSLRLWYPRFSYNVRFLPALYRENPGSADFLDRFLANMEGINTVLEGRIAAAQWLFDPRIADAETLQWLASWFDVMLDPSWREERRRLFLRHVTEFLGWRGTRAGLLMALRLAFDTSLGDRDFVFGGALAQGPGSIRIVEQFSTGAYGRRVSGASVGAGGPSTLPLGEAWGPDEGSSGLFARMASPGQVAEPLAEGISEQVRHVSEQVAGRRRFPLFADDTLQGEARAVARRALTLAPQVFGFVPQAGAIERQGWRSYQIAETGDDAHPDLPHGYVDPAVAELWSGYLALPSATRAAWQAFLARRYRRIEALRSAHGAGWSDFDEIPLPDYLPDRDVAIRDWLLFEGQLLPRRRTAHRFAVLLPLRSVSRGAADLEAEMALARRIVEIEKPAHTVCDVRFYWAMNRLGEARLGSDTELGPGSRAPDLVPPAILGRSYLGSAFVGGPQGRAAGRERLAC